MVGRPPLSTTVVITSASRKKYPGCGDGRLDANCQLNCSGGNVLPGRSKVRRTRTNPPFLATKPVLLMATVFPNATSALKKVAGGAIAPVGCCVVAAASMATLPGVVGNSSSTGDAASHEALLCPTQQMALSETVHVI